MSEKGYNAATLPRKLTEVVELLILQLVLQHVGITLGWSFEWGGSFRINHLPIPTVSVGRESTDMQVRF